MKAVNFNTKAAISAVSASGMGLLFAEILAELGGNVVMCDVSEKAFAEKRTESNGERNAMKRISYEKKNLLESRKTFADLYGSSR